MKTRNLAAAVLMVWYAIALRHIYEHAHRHSHFHVHRGSGEELLRSHSGLPGLDHLHSF